MTPIGSSNFKIGVSGSHIRIALCGVEALTDLESARRIVARLYAAIRDVETAELEARQRALFPSGTKTK